MSVCTSCKKQFPSDFLDKIMDEMAGNQNPFYKIDYTCPACNAPLVFEKELGMYYFINSSNKEIIGAK